MPKPDYFLALMKQYANLVSDQEAEHLSTAISSSLYMNLDENSRTQIFAALPSYLQPKKQVFGLRHGDAQAQYDTHRFVRHAIIKTGLTDENELASALRAYFKSIKILGSRASNQIIADYLPASLHRLFAEC